MVEETMGMPGGHEESGEETIEELNRQIRNLSNRLKTSEKNLQEWSMDPEATQPLSSVPQIIELINKEIEQRKNKLEQLTKRRDEMKEKK